MRYLYFYENVIIENNGLIKSSSDKANNQNRHKTILTRLYTSRGTKRTRTESGTRRGSRSESDLTMTPPPLSITVFVLIIENNI